MTAATVLGGVLGLVAAGGLLLVWRRLPRRRRPRLVDRLAPYLGPVDGGRDQVSATGAGPTPGSEVRKLVQLYLDRAAGALERVLGGSASVRRRLAQAGSDLTVHEFRVEQLVWGAAGFGMAAAVSVLILAGGTSSAPAGLAVFCLAAAVGGVVARDQWLSRAVRDRQQRMLGEFPVVADLMALSVTAGEGAVGALERVSRVGSGELAAEIRRALADTRAGTTLVGALDGVADRTRLVPLARFVDGIAVAVERGTPLSEVLRAQAADVREVRRRSLLEAGGRKEIAMMVPVVFMVLPITILFALYPGLVQISAVVP